MQFLILFLEQLHRSLSRVTESRRSNSNNLDNVQKQVKRFLFRKPLIINRISSMTYFSKYLDIYRYSRNGTFFFFLFKLLHIFLYKPKYLPFYLYSCKILILRLMKNKKDLLNFFFSFCSDVHVLIISVIMSIIVSSANETGALCANTREKQLKQN